MTVFDNPPANETFWVNGFQHYKACGWRGKTWVATTNRRKGGKEVLLTNKDGEAVWADDEGNFCLPIFQTTPEDHAKLLENVQS